MTAFQPSSGPTALRQPQNGKVLFTVADGTSSKALYITGPNGTKVIVPIIGFSTDSSAHDVVIGVNAGGSAVAGGPITGGVNSPLGTTTIPIGAGNTAGVLPVNVTAAFAPLLATDSDNQSYFLLVPGDILYAQLKTALTANLISIFAPTIADF